MGQAQGHQHVMTEITEDQSGSEYGSDDGTATIISKDSRITPINETQAQSNKFPRIPSTASGLAGADSYSVVANAKIVPLPKSKLNSNSIGKSGQKKTPILKRYSTITTPTSSSKLTSSVQGSPSRLNGSKPSSPLALRRSTAVQNLSKTRPSPSPGLLSPTNASAKSPGGGGGGGGGGDGSPRKTRTQRKEQKARDKVEDILKASWSDRALTSPPLGGGDVATSLVEQLGGKVQMGIMSPGLEETGGIEQRLAMLRRVEL